MEHIPLVHVLFLKQYGKSSECYSLQLIGWSVTCAWITIRFVFRKYKYLNADLLLNIELLVLHSPMAFELASEDTQLKHSSRCPLHTFDFSLADDNSIYTPLRSFFMVSFKACFSESNRWYKLSGNGLAPNRPSTPIVTTQFTLRVKYTSPGPIFTNID